MASKSKLSIARRFKEVLEHSAQLTRTQVDSDGLSVGQATLSDWQCDRLRKTYADLSTNRRYKKAVEFFLTDLYGPVDFSQRDNDIARVYPLMVKVLSADAIESLTQGLELNTLTMELDMLLLQVLIDECGFDPAHGELDFETYAQGYKACDNYEQRKTQIEMIGQIGQKLEHVTRNRLILTAVQLARRPARLAGFGELQSFIERGLAGFRAMGSATEFLQTVEYRETKLLDAIYKGEPIPEDIRVA